MKAQELRLGNYVKLSNFDKDGYHELYVSENVKIDGFGDASNIDDCELRLFYSSPSIIGGTVHSGCLDRDVEGISLTKEWLTNLGLEERYVPNEWSWYKCKKEGIWDSYTEIRKRKNGYIYIRDYKPLKYVHELQNLYYALTGEELTLN